MIKLEYTYGHNGNGVKNLINLLNQEANIFFYSWAYFDFRI